MDRSLSAKIREDIRTAVLQGLETSQEVWISESEVLRTFQMFTKDWMRRYGHTLPRTRAIVHASDGSTRQSGWAYGRNRIQRMILDETIKNIKVTKL